jgi:hypothetical protein
MRLSQHLHHFVKQNILWQVKFLLMADFTGEKIRLTGEVWLKDYIPPHKDTEQK